MHLAGASMGAASYLDAPWPSDCRASRLELHPVFYWPAPASCGSSAPSGLPPTLDRIVGRHEDAPIFLCTGVRAVRSDRIRSGLEKFLVLRVKMADRRVILWQRLVEEFMRRVEHGIQRVG